ncbi:DUF4148 domain-containing protein, partial [Hydrogenophaga crassostreae]
MKSATFSAIALAIASAVAAPAFAADTGLTREQVRSQLEAAVRSGDTVANSETGLTFNQMYPQNYTGQAAVAQAKTRADVKGELAEAVRTGNVIANSESGQTLSQTYPGQYAAQ